jgi:predicted enzyme related to lactoylglutathione lyase
MPRQVVSNGTKMALFWNPANGCVWGDINDSAELSPGPGWVFVFINVDGKLDEVLWLVEIAGWEIVSPKTEIWGWWEIATIKDTEWNVVWFRSK